MLRRTDLSLLMVFDAIFNEGSLTKASRVLNLTQPAVSHALARLRERFDDVLFVRRDNQMVPTPVAQRIAQTLRPALASLNSALRQFDLFDPTQQSRQFNLSLRDVLESTCLPPLMQRLSEFPNIDLTSQRIDRRDMEERLASSKLDFALDVMLPVSDTIGHTRLRKDHWVVVAAANHPRLCSEVLSVADYLQARHVLVSSRSEGPGLEDFEMDRLGLRRRIGLRCQHYFAACRVVAETDMLLTMPATYASIINHHLPTRLIAPPFPLPDIEVHLYWYQPWQDEPALLWMRQLLLSTLAAETV